LCLTPLSTIFKAYRGGSALLVEETGYPDKSTDLPQVTGKLYHIMLYEYNSPWVGFEFTTLEVIGTDCTGSYYVNQIKLKMKNMFSYIVKKSILKETYLMKKYQIYLKMQVIKMLITK
jgi:hypothetical protein